MTSKKTSIFLLVLGVGLGILSLAFGNNLFSLLGVSDESNRTMFSIFSAIFFTLTSFFVSILSFLKIHTDSVEDQIGSLKKKLVNGFNVERFDGLRGMQTISHRIQNAKLVLNTRIIHPETLDKNKIYAEDARIWEKKGIEALNKGVRFRDVVLNAGRFFAEDLVKKLKENKSIDPTRYRARDITGKASPYINFIVIEFEQGEDEVWFGWVMSSDGEVVSDTFRSVDSDMVKFFKNLHTQLFSLGDEIE
ncbi:hypothetical protein [Flagellimonas allohymeniacidonis]|uniref:Uncharacterized protein n=1 Tax=Flagellimonas allohymeniacidonis TaxID=2517819 RepID=A0A4Q8QB79_9FLAO|nr:hypothetical protein [Allomuricauda hymeniacidonis]TAI47602.1 hypothetical protein EW142_13135 [Allomuricauda hymeniacidonis]